VEVWKTALDVLERSLDARLKAEKEKEKEASS